MAFPETNQRRWLEELRSLRRLVGSFTLTRTAPPVVEGSVLTDSGSRRYRLMWPPDYPYRPPSLWELSEAGDIVDNSWNGHAFADGSVCLYGHRPEDGWRPEFSAAHAVDRFRQFVDAVDRSSFPRVVGLPLEVSHTRVSIHPKVMHVLRNNAGWGLMSGWLRADGRLVMVTCAESTTASRLVAGGITEEPSLPWRSALGLATPWTGVWCKVDATIGDAPPDRAGMARWLRGKVVPEAARIVLEKQRCVLLVGENTCWFTWLNPPEEVQAALDACGVSVMFTVPVEEEIPKKLFARADARLQHASSLRRARVAVVGVGSLGGGVAVALARAGVGRFTLFDPDNLEPENVARHVGGVIDIGTPKVDAIGRAIQRINPDAEVTRVPSALSLDPAAWHTDSMRQLREVLADPHGIVVCTAATTEAERVINALCVADRAPAVFATVLGNADHGRVFRVIPGQTACYQCVLSAQANDPARFPRFETRDIGEPAYPQPGIPGLGLDVDEIAVLTARLALQTLATRIVGGIGYPAAHADHFLWSARGDWAVDGPLQTRAERIPRHAECPICGPGSDAALGPDEAAELARLVSGAVP